MSIDDDLNICKKVIMIIVFKITVYKFENKLSYSEIALANQNIFQ